MRPAGLALRAAYGCLPSAISTVFRLSRSARLRIDEARRPRSAGSLWLFAFGYLHCVPVVSLRSAAECGFWGGGRGDARTKALRHEGGFLDRISGLTGFIGGRE
jgi:hypothetical protein